MTNDCMSCVTYVSIYLYPLRTSGCFDPDRRSLLRSQCFLNRTTQYILRATVAVVARMVSEALYLIVVYRGVILRLKMCLGEKY